MKKLSVLFLSILTILSSCKDDGDLGLSIQNPDDLVGTKLIDSLTFNAATVLYQANSYSDSTNILLVGNYNDPYTGQITAKSFFQLRQTETGGLGTNPVCDSVKLELFLALNNSVEARVFGDTLKPTSFHLYKLTESIASKKYLNSEMVSTATTPFSSIENTALKPISDSYMVFNLDKSFGTEIFSTWNNPEAMLATFKGFSLQSSEDDAAIYAININNLITRLRIFYHNDESAGLEKNLAITTEALRFNQVLSERSSTMLSSLQNDGDFVLDANTNGELFLQSGTGLALALNLPSLKQVIDSLKGSTINKAEIILHMKPNTYTGAASRPTQINSLLEADNSFLPKKEGEKLVGVLIDKKFTTEVNPNYISQTYTIALTSYFQELVLGDKTVSNLFLQPLENGSSVGKSVICGPNYTDATLRPKLKIYYTR